MPNESDSILNSEALRRAASTSESTSLRCDQSKLSVDSSCTEPTEKKRKKERKKEKKKEKEVNTAQRKNGYVETTRQQAAPSRACKLRPTFSAWAAALL